MKSLSQFIDEKLILQKDSIMSKKRFTNMIVVNSTKELSELIDKRAYTNDYNHQFVKNIDLSDVDISKLDNLNKLFEWWAFETIDISGWDTSNVKDMSQMFYGCEKLTDIIGIDEINIDNVINMNFMFAYCGKLRITDNIKHWKIDPRDVKTVHMFLECPTTLKWTDKH